MTRSALISSYHELAGEYYDAERHPTSANFRDGSVLLVERWVDDDANPSDINWDVGAGDSVLAEVLNARGLALDRTTALDSSPSMLAYSEKWSASGLRLLPGDATQIPAADASAALVLASLGDAYNTDDWWKEATRVLAPGGVCLFTTPTHEWADRLRDGSESDVAEFELSDGRTILVPSLISAPEEQARRIERFGLIVERIDYVTRGELRARRALSSKLAVLPDEDAPVVRSYRIVKG